MSLDRHLAIEQGYRDFEAGNLASAESRCNALLEKNKDDLQASRLLALVSYTAARYEKAAALLKRCIGCLPNEPIFQHDLGRVYAAMGRFDEAVLRYDKAMELKPNYIEAVAAKADALERKNDYDAARKFLDPYMKAGTDDDGLAVVLIKAMEKEGQQDQAIALAERLLAVPERDRVARRMLNLQIGRIYDKVGRYGDAFAAFTRANGSGGLPFHPGEYVEQVDQLIGMFSAENLAVLPRAKNKSELPVFIACMPRSGSTLVEQILHAHPKAVGIGEHDDLHNLVGNLQERIESFQTYPACIADLRQPHLDQFSESYLTLCRKLGKGATRVVNKHLINYRHLGMVEMLFPGARVIHIRRNRIDNGLACYMAALSPAQFPWIADQRHVGLVWREYERLMTHWREVLKTPILEVCYEELVEDTEGQIRRIIDFCGLEWDDRCLRYYEVDRKVMTLSSDQVRKPIFKTAVMRYKRYEEFLGPLKESLGEPL